jgi:uncharacterized protein YheU (UPF0270 family)
VDLDQALGDTPTFRAGLNRGEQEMHKLETLLEKVRDILSAGARVVWSRTRQTVRVVRCAVVSVSNRLSRCPTDCCRTGKRFQLPAVC